MQPWADWGGAEWVQFRNQKQHNPELLKIASSVAVENALLYSSNITQMSWLIWGCRIRRACLHLLGLISVWRLPRLNFKRFPFPSCNENKTNFFSFFFWQSENSIPGWCWIYCSFLWWWLTSRTKCCLVRVCFDSIASCTEYKYNCTGLWHWDCWLWSAPTAFCTLHSSPFILLVCKWWGKNLAIVAISLEFCCVKCLFCF